MSAAGIVAIPVALPEPQDTEEPPRGPCHPACAQHADSDYCRESWQLHLAELRDNPGTHWHKCDHGRLCALVPVVHHRRCLAVVKLTCASLTDEAGFVRQVELLDLLVKDFVTQQGDSLNGLVPGEPVDEESCKPHSTTEAGIAEPPCHPQVLRALEYIDKHLSDPRLTVGMIASELDINASYLGSIFADQVGQRMNWYIAARRVELAKTLLAKTDRQVKVIARNTGHANPNWFCHVFRVHTGLTPNGYRRQSRPSAASNAQEDPGRTTTLP